jgi:hypothetical protein
VQFSRPFRRRRLEKHQQLERIETTGGEQLRQAVDAGKGVMVVANHSAHFDSEVLYAAADEVRVPLHFMTAWQVFAMSGALGRWAMRRMGCFSVDREGNDRQAFKQAVEILQTYRHPLVIFPEGDIYHRTDAITPFREGAAAIALSAAKRAEREVVIVPCGIKFWYLDDPTEELLKLLVVLEERVLLRPRPDLALKPRIYRLAEGMLALKELDYLGESRTGTIRERIEFLTEAVLAALEQRHGLKGKAARTPERVKALRQDVIKKLDAEEAQANGRFHANGQAQRERETRQRELGQDMDDLFFVMQLYSHPGDYLAGQPSIERIAETLDKFEEDLFNLELPTVRGRRIVRVHFGEPIRVPGDDRRRDGVVELTQSMQDRVQGIVNGLNAERAAPAS